jgi:hypothetical protein
VSETPKFQTMIIGLGVSSCCNKKTAGTHRKANVLGKADGQTVTNSRCEDAKSRNVSIKSNVKKSDFVSKGMKLIRRNIFRSFC